MRVYKRFESGRRIVLRNADCMDLLADMPDNSVHLTITSPPYCMGKAYENSTSVDDFVKLHEIIFPEIVRVTKPGGSICWQVGYHVSHGAVLPLDYLVHQVAETIDDLTLRNRIIWTFGHGLHCKRRFSGRHETVLWYTKGADYKFNLDSVRVAQKYPGKTHYKGPNRGLPSGHPNGKNPTNVWEIPNVKANHVEKTDHPCQFPIALAQRLVLALSKRGNTVLDPFAGSGSTGCAALLEGRRFVGSEIDESFYDLAVARCRDAAAGKLQYRPLDKPLQTPNPRSRVARPPNHS